MDLSTLIVDMLRGDEAAKLGLSTPATPKPSSPGPAEMSAGVTELSVPGYTAYKREALANGEPVMSPEEFKNAARQ